MTGRPREEGRERYENGRVKPVGPTEETAAKHRERARALRIPAAKDPGYAESTIGVFEARAMVTADEARVLIQARETFERLFGKGVPSGSSIERTYGSGTARGEPQETAYLRRQWSAYKHAIDAVQPRRVRDEFENVILRNRFRQWMTYGQAVLTPEWIALYATIQGVVSRMAPSRGTEMSDAHRRALEATE